MPEHSGMAYSILGAGNTNNRQTSRELFAFTYFLFFLFKKNNHIKYFFITLLGVVRQGLASILNYDIGNITETIHF